MDLSKRPLEEWEQRAKVLRRHIEITKERILDLEQDIRDQEALVEMITNYVNYQKRKER